ncbi:MAG TPA: hypothetical protein VGM23_03805 [Armatimonadota bacterium]
MATNLQQEDTERMRLTEEPTWSACPLCGSPTPLHCLRDHVRHPIERATVWFLGVIAVCLSCILLVELWLGQAVYDIPIIRQWLFEH